MGVANLRAIETLWIPPKQQLFSDEFAIHMNPAPFPRLDGFLTGLFIQRFGWVVAKLVSRQFPGLPESVSCRTKFIDDSIHTAIGKGVKQVVILGAGYDARALRLATKGVVFFEVDRPQIQLLKKERIAAITSSPPATYVSVDFQEQNLEHEMAKAGFDTQSPTALIMEGVVPYIPHEGFEDTLSFIAKLQSVSAFVFTYMEHDALHNLEGFHNCGRDTADLKRFIQHLTDKGEPLISAHKSEELPELLGRFGLRLEQNAGFKECRRYLADRGRNANGPREEPSCAERWVVASNT